MKTCNSGDWGRSKARERYDVGGRLSTYGTRGDMKSTMPNGPSDNYIPPSESDRKTLSDMAAGKKHGGRTKHSDEAEDRRLIRSMIKAHDKEDDDDGMKSGGTAHPGFKAVQSSIAKKQGVSSERAGAILAASSRNASKAAHKANPRLNKVKG